MGKVNTMDDETELWIAGPSCLDKTKCSVRKVMTGEIERTFFFLKEKMMREVGRIAMIQMIISAKLACKFLHPT